MKSLLQSLVKSIKLEPLLIKILHVVVEEIKEALTNHQPTLKK